MINFLKSIDKYVKYSYECKKFLERWNWVLCSIIQLLFAGGFNYMKEWISSNFLIIFIITQLPVFYMAAQQVRKNLFCHKPNIININGFTQDFENIFSSKWLIDLFDKYGEINAPKIYKELLNKVYDYSLILYKDNIDLHSFLLNFKKKAEQYNIENILHPYKAIKSIQFYNRSEFEKIRKSLLI